MKDTIISAAFKRREILLLAGSFLFAFLMNVYSVIKYRHPATELFTQLHVVLLLSLIIYTAGIILRIIWWVAARIYRLIIK